MLWECRFEVWQWFKDAGIEAAISKIEVKYAGHWTGGVYALVTCPTLELAQRAFNVAYNWTSRVRFGMSVELSYVGIRWLGDESDCRPYPPYSLLDREPYVSPVGQPSVPIAPQPGQPSVTPWVIDSVLFAPNLHSLGQFPPSMPGTNSASTSGSVLSIPDIPRTSEGLLFPWARLQ